jgi:hypothetical protein
MGEGGGVEANQDMEDDNEDGEDIENIKGPDSEDGSDDGGLYMDSEQ